jgi:hypothetical protein
MIKLETTQGNASECKASKSTKIPDLSRGSARHYGTSESKEQAAHEKLTEIARKRPENPMSYKQEINTTMKASIHLEVRFFRNGGKF